MIMRYAPYHAKAAAADLGAAGQEQADFGYLKPALDVADGLGRVMNNKKLYFRLLRSFSGLKMAEDIGVAVGDGDHGHVQQAAHALKGVAANLGLRELMSVSLKIEARAKGLEAAEDLLPGLKTAVDAAEEAIECLLAKEE